MSADTYRADDRAIVAGKLLDAGTAGLALFLATNVVLQFMPPRYSWVTQAVSDLAVGPFGLAMGFALFISGLSVLAIVLGAIMATTRGTRPMAGLLLLGIWGACGVAISFFPTDIVDANGYPGSVLAFATSTTTHGKIHLTIASVSFLSMVLGLLTASIRFDRDPRLRRIRLPGLIISCGALVGLFLIDPLGTHSIFGLLERGVSLLGIAWVTMLARQLRRPLDPDV